jgi:hypothetical protein
MKCSSFLINIAAGTMGDGSFLLGSETCGHGPEDEEMRKIIITHGGT